MYTPFNKIEFTNLNYRIDRLLQPGTYIISCEYDKLYISQAKRPYRTRLGEHKSSVKNDDVKSFAMANHS